MREKLEEDMHMRLKKEGAREEKRRRLGNLVEQHKQVKQKGEQQLVAEGCPELRLSVGYRAVDKNNGKTVLSVILRFAIG